MATTFSGTTFSGNKKVNWKNTKPTEIVNIDRKRRGNVKEGGGGGGVGRIKRSVSQIN